MRRFGRVAAEDRCATADYAASLTIFFAGPFGLAAMQVGRNLLVYRLRGGDYGMVFDVNHRMARNTSLDPMRSTKCGSALPVARSSSCAWQAEPFIPSLEEDERLPSDRSSVRSTIMRQAQSTMAMCIVASALSCEPVMPAAISKKI